MIELELLLLKPGAFVKCIGWGGETSRERLTDAQALMLLDPATRTIEIVPVGRGDGMTIPVENALQWKPKPQAKPRTTRAGAATSAKAPA